MPRFIIETDEEQEHRNYLNGPALHSAVWEFSNELRNKYKYSGEESTTWEKVREMFYECCGEAMSAYEG